MKVKNNQLRTLIKQWIRSQYLDAYCIHSFQFFNQLIIKFKIIDDVQIQLDT